MKGYNLKTNRVREAATNFNSSELNNLPTGKCQGKAIVSATNRYLTLEDGRIVPTKGNHVTYDYIPSNEYYDDTETEGDKL